MPPASVVQRVLRVFPFTCLAVLITLVLVIALPIRAERNGPDAFSWSDATIGFYRSEAFPLVVLLVVMAGLGLALDGMGIADRSREWDEVVPMSATAFEQLATTHFVEAGWQPQRDEPDFKLYVRNRGGRPAAASISIDSVLGGTHVRMSLSREAADGERLPRAAHRLARDRRPDRGGLAGLPGQPDH